MGTRLYVGNLPYSATADDLRQLLWALPSRGTLETRWSRFPTYAALNDSIRDEGGRLDHGPIRFDLTPSGVVATRVSPGRRSLVTATTAMANPLVAFSGLGSEEEQSQAQQDQSRDEAAEETGADTEPERQHQHQHTQGQ